MRKIILKIFYQEFIIYYCSASYFGLFGSPSIHFASPLSKLTAFPSVFGCCIKDGQVIFFICTKSCIYAFYSSSLPESELRRALLPHAYALVPLLQQYKFSSIIGLQGRYLASGHRSKFSNFFGHLANVSFLLTDFLINLIV